jgi:hypothetical protein
VKRVLAVLALLAFGTSAVYACEGEKMKDAKSDAAVPQQSKPAPRG